MNYPCIYYACPCVDIVNDSESEDITREESEKNELNDKNFPTKVQGTSDSHVRVDNKRKGQIIEVTERWNYGIYPLEYLFYCTECQEIRCPRCSIEEVVNWFCPSCLFEVPSSSAKSDGNRCIRSCFDCPICTSPLMLNSLESNETENTGNSNSGSTGGFFLACAFCNWSSLDVGIKFSKPNNIANQLSRMIHRSRPKPESFSRVLDSPIPCGGGTMNGQMADQSGKVNSISAGYDVESVFTNLLTFYKSQLKVFVEIGRDGGSNDIGYGSPSSINRLLNIYGAASSSKSPEMLQSLREAMTINEGFREFDQEAEYKMIQRMSQVTFHETLSSKQKDNQSRGDNGNIRFTSDLRPVSTLLHTKRARRCHKCRHIFSKPDVKISSAHVRIKLLAMSFVPNVFIQPFSSSTHGSHRHALSSSMNQANFRLRAHTIQHFVLTVLNPLFKPITVSLAAPYAPVNCTDWRVTILCPHFEVGPNSDAWDDALTNYTNPSRSSEHSSDPTNQLESGKVLSRGRNWTSVVIELVVGSAPRENHDVVGDSGGGGAGGLTGPGLNISEFGNACRERERDGEKVSGEEGQARRNEEKKSIRVVDPRGPLIEMPLLLRVESDDFGGEEDANSVFRLSTSSATSNYRSKSSDTVKAKSKGVRSMWTLVSWGHFDDNMKK